MKAILLAMCFFSLNAFADADLPAQRISSIATGWGSEGLFLYFDGNNKVEGCTWTRVRVDKNHAMLKDILSIALSAFHAKKKVIIRVSGCFGNDMNGTAIKIVDY
ncbi:hypothetical protein ACPV54_10710 [Vibrio mediterranei]